jgi:hypothetical protein
MAKAPAAPLGAELLGVPKGAAAPGVSIDQAASASRSSLQRTPAVVPPPMEEARASLTVRLPVSTMERLREAAHRTRAEKQAIVDDALIAWLDNHEL